MRVTEAALSFAIEHAWKGLPVPPGRLIKSAEALTWSFNVKWQKTHTDFHQLLIQRWPYSSRWPNPFPIRLQHFYYQSSRRNTMLQPNLRDRMRLVKHTHACTNKGTASFPGLVYPSAAALACGRAGATVREAHVELQTLRVQDRLQTLSARGDK